MADLLSIAVSGLSASQAAIATTGNNISNANTPGYSREVVNLTPQVAQFTGAGYVGSGVTVSSIQRVVNQIYVGQLRSDTSTYNELNTYSTQISQLDSLLAGSTTGLSPALQTTFADLQQASQNPADVPTRQVVLSDVGNLTQSFNSLYQSLQSQSQAVSQSFATSAAQATTLAQNIAALNQSIVAQSGTGAQPNSLLDQRDELLRQLSQIVGVSVVPQTNGAVNVFMGTGQALVVGNTANTLSTQPSTTDPTQQVITLTVGSSTIDVTQNVTGGSLGGLVQFQNGTLNNAYNTLGRIAISLADAMNNQQKLGVDLNGNTGTNLFTDINTSAEMSARALRASTNTGADQPSVFIDNASALTTSDYKLSFSSAAAYTVTRLSDNTTVSAGTLAPGQTTIPATGDIDGFQIQVSATPTFAAGDYFSIQPTRQGAQDIAVSLQTPQGLAFAQPILTNANIANTGGGTISQGVMVPQYQPVTAGTNFTLAAPLTTLTTPMVVQYTSATTYQILNNTNPAAPTAFVPPLTGTIIPGQNNVVQINDSTGTSAYQFTLSGNPASGDQFSVATNNSGSSDNRNALALASLNNVLAVNGLSFSSAYGSLVSAIGSTTASLQNSTTAANTLLTQSQSNRDSVSAVSLDEEAANLIKFQQVYSANAQVVSIARSLFTTLLGAFTS